MGSNDSSKDTSSFKQADNDSGQESKLNSLLPNIAKPQESDAFDIDSLNADSRNADPFATHSFANDTPATDSFTSLQPTGVDADALADMQTYSNLQEKRKKAKRKKTITIIVVCVVILALIVGGSMWLVSSMTADPHADIPLQTAYVEQGLFLDEVSASGKLKPISSVIATPEVEGIVGEVYVSEGDIVTEGQVLYTIVNDELDKAITLAQQGINEAYNAVVQAQIAVDDAYYAKQLGSSYVPEEGEQPFDTRQADSAIRQAELSLSSAWTAYSNAEAEYNDAVARAEKRTVLSPITGSVVAVNIEPGKNLMSSGGSSVTTPVQIADLSSMLVSVEVNEVDILKISADQTAQLTFSAIPDLVQTGKVVRIATVNTGGSEGMDMGMSGTVTYTVDIIIEEPDLRLKPGMTAKASIESQRIENVLMVPISAVTLLSETEGLVYVMNADDPDNPEERSVEILASNGLTMAVKGKISAGDELIAGGDMGMMEMDMSSGGTVVMSDSSGQVIVE